MTNLELQLQDFFDFSLLERRVVKNPARDI